MLEERDRAIEERDRAIEERDRAIEERDRAIEERDRVITQLSVRVAELETLTLYHRASGRGKDSMHLGGVLPAFTGIAVHDGLPAYRKYDVAHGLCAAHHLQELAGMAAATGQDWREC